MRSSCCIYNIVRESHKEPCQERCLAAQVRRIHRVVMSSYDEALRPLGLTVGQLDMLMTTLDLVPPVSPADLGRALLMDRSTVSRNLRRLEAQGLLRAHATGRAHVIEISPKGKRVLQRAYAPWSQTQERIKDQIGPDGVNAVNLLVSSLGKES